MSSPQGGVEEWDEYPKAQVYQGFHFCVFFLHCLNFTNELAINFTGKKKLQQISYFLE